MGFSLDGYINSKKKKQGQTEEGGYFQFGQPPQAATTTRPVSAATPTGSAAGGGSGFSLDDYIIDKGIRSGQLQKQDTDFNSWLSDVQSFSKRMSGDYTARQSAYQAPAAFRAYQDKTGTEISDLLKRAYSAQNYYTQYGKTYDEVYGAGSSSKLLEQAKQNIDYLEGVRKGLQSERDWWEQFQDEAAYDTYRRYQGYADIPKAEDFEEKSRYVQDFDEGRIARNPFTQEYLDTGHKDLTYAVLNKDPDAVSRSVIANYKHYKEPDEDTLKAFNYIYATQGAEAAYQYLDDMEVGENFSGIEAMALGAYQGVGLASLTALLGKGISSITGDEEAAKRNEEWYGDMMRDVSQAQEQHPVAYGAGAVGGNLALLYGTGAVLGAAEGALATGIKIGGKTVAVQMAPAVQGVVNSSLSFLTADAVRNAGSVATGYMDPSDYLKSMGVSGAQGLAGGLAGGLVGSGMAKVLRETGMMTPFMEFIRQTTSGFASAGANIGTGYLLSEEKPSNEQIATDLATAFLFSVIQGGISTYKVTQATKAQMNAALDEIIQRYGQMAQSWKSMTPEARAEAASYIMEQTQSLRNGVNSYYMAGQQATVDQLNQALDALTQGMQGYINGFQAYQSATAAPGNLLGAGSGGASGGGTGLVPTSPVSGGEIAKLQGQLQAALTQGISQAQTTTPAGIAPAGAVVALSGGTGIAPIDKALQALASGGTVSNNMAEDILTSPEAVAALEQAAQVSVTGDMTLAQQRAAVKQAVNGLARSDMGTLPTEAGNDTPATEKAVMGTQKPQAQTIQRTEAIMARDQKKVEQFSGVLGKAGKAVMSKMYDPSVAAEAYLPAMSAYYNAGRSGGDMAQVYEKVGGAVTPQQAQAAYLAGQADKANNPQPVVGELEGYDKITQQTMEEVQGYEQAAEEIHLRNGGQRTDGAYPGGPVQELESGAGQNQGGDFQAQPADAGAASLSYGKQVTTASLGIGGGSTSDSIRLVTGGDTAATTSAKALAKERGMRLTLFAGGNLSIDQGGGIVASVRGYVSGDRVFIRADHPEYTADQIMRHETGHDMISKGEIDPQTVRERISKELGGEKVQQLAGVYEAAYRGTSLTADEVWEEVICDSLGDMNIFSGTVHEGAAKELLEPTKKAASAEREVPRTRGPPAKDAAASREEAKDKFSQETENKYLEAVKSGNMEVAEKLVKQAADDAGYTDVVYHGTQAFGFTEFDLGKSDDGITIFAAGSPELAGTYSGRTGTKGISGQSDIEKMELAEVVSALNKEEQSDASEMQHQYALYKMEDVNRLIGKVNDGIENLKPLVEQKISEYADRMAQDFNEKDEKAHRMLVQLSEALGQWAYDKISTPLYMLLHHTDAFPRDSAEIDNLEADIRLMNALRVRDVSDGVVVQQGLSGYTVQVFSPKSARDLLKIKYAEGNYALYGRPGKRVTIDCKGRNWNNIPADWANAIAPTVDGTEVVEADGSYYLIDKERQITIDGGVLDANEAVQRMSDKERHQFLVQKATSILYVQTSGARTTRDVAKWVKSRGFDSVRFDEIMDNGGRAGDAEAGSVYIYFDPTSLKSAEPVVYDDSGEIIPLSERFDNKKTDIRFSQELESIESLRRENRELKASLEEFKEIAKTTERKAAQAAYWKGQTKRTTPETLTVRQGDVAKLAKSLTASMESTAAPAEIAKGLTELGEYLLRGEKGTGDIDTHKVWQMALDIGKELVETAQARTDTLYEDYAELRSYLRQTPFTISETDSHDIADFGDFRKRNFGRIRIGKGETNIDAFYDEMSEMWPEFFDGKRENGAGDMLLKMEEVLNLLTPIYDNPYSYHKAEAIQFATNAVLDGIMGESVRQQAPTFADRQAKKLEAAIAKGKQAVAREREKRNEQVQRVKDHYAQVRQAQAARKADSKARSRLLSIAKRLNNRKLPAANRALLDQYIGELDLTAKSMTGATLEKLTDLRDWYDGVTNPDSSTYDPDFIPDEATKRKLERLSKKQIASLSAQEVADLTEALLHIENELRTAKKLIDSKDKRDVYRMGHEVIRDLENVEGSKATGLGAAVDKFVLTETLSPVRQLRRMVGYVDSDPLLHLTEELAAGQRAMLDYQMRAEKPFEKYASDDTFTQNFSGRKAEGIKVVGLTKDGPVEVTITPAMRASLYLHSLNDQNLRHIKEGGVTVPDEKLYRAGKIAEAYARGKTVKLTPSQVKMICAGMTAEEKAYAAEAGRYFNTTSPEAINAVSEKLKGYSLAQVENYFPINTDTSFTKTDFEAIKKDGSIEGMGWTKERINAATPILLRDLDAVLTQSIQQHAKYVGLAIPVRNFNKVWGVTTASYNDDGSRNSYEASVQSAVKRAWGETGYKYIEKMMADIQGSTQAKNEWAKALSKVRSNYAGAVLTLNASVAMKQAASYPTAAAVLGWKPLLRAMADNGKVNLELIAKYTPLQWYRSKGYSTKELGDINASNSSRFKAWDWMRGKDLPPILNWVQAMDLLTTRKLWKATEYYIRDTRRDLTVGTDDYYKAVAEVYNRVIEETQPNYTTMQRPQLLRSEDSLMANLAMFKTQPFQNFNILYDAAKNWEAKARYAKNGSAEQAQAEQEARRDFGRAVTSQLAQLAVFAAMTAAWAFFRGKTDKYEDEDTGDVTTTSFLSAFSKDMVGGLLSTVPFGSDAWEALSSKMFGDTYYGMDVSTVATITDTIQSIDGLTDLVGSIFKSATSGEDINWNSARLKLDDYLDDISKAAGVPHENIVNLFNAAYRQASIAALGEYQGEYAALKLTTDPAKYSRDYYDVLYRALQGDRAAYEAIYEDMVGSGTFSEEKVQSAMEKRMKDAQGVTKASELEQRYLSPDQEKVYNRVLGEIAGSEVWRSASTEQRDKLEDSLYDLTVANGAGVKLQEKIDAGATYGIDEADYLLFRLALDLVDQPTESGKMGSYTNDEVEEAIGMLTGLSGEAKSFLWTSQGKSDKSNPWG